MKRIIPWQILMVLVTIGTYVALLAGGGSRETAVAFAGTAAVAAAVTAAVAVAFAAVFAVAAVTTTAVAAAFTSAAVVAVAFAVVAAAVFAAEEELGIPKRWTFVAMGIEAGTIYGALTVGSVGWAIAIGTLGILALLAMWKFGPVAVPIVAALREDTERSDLDRRITSTERDLADLRARRAALGAAPTGAAPARTNG